MWEPTNGPWGGHVTNLDMAEDGTIYMGTYGAGVWRSTNEARSWEWVSSGISMYSNYIMAVKAGSGEVAFAAPQGMGVYRTDNKGDFWHSKNNLIGDFYVNDIAVDPRDKTNVLVSTQYGGVCRSTSEGDAWFSTPLSPEVSPVNCLAAAGRGGYTEFYAGTQYHGIWKSSDGGQTWRSVSPEVFSAYNINAVTIAPSNPDIVYASYYYGVFKTKNAGLTWEATPISLGSGINKIRVDPLSPEVLYIASGNTGGGVSGGIYKSTDGGKTATLISTPISVESTFLYTDALIDPVKPNLGYFGNWGSGVFKSYNYGATFEVSNTGLNNLIIKALAVASAEGKTLMYAFAKAYIWANYYNLGIMKSDDGGNSWSRLSTFPTTYEVTKILFHPASPEIIYVGVAYNKPCLFKSKDSGATWIGYDIGSENDLVDLTFDPRSSEVEYAFAVSTLQSNYASDSVYRSDDLGTTWSLWTDNLPTNEGMSCLHACYSSAGTVVFAGTGRSPPTPGIYRRWANSGSWESAAGTLQLYAYADIDSLTDIPTRETVIMGYALANIGKKSVYDSAITWEAVAGTAYVPTDFAIDSENPYKYFLSCSYQHFFSIDENRVPKAIEENFGVPLLNPNFVTFYPTTWPIALDPNSPTTARMIFGGIPGRSVWKAESVSQLPPVSPSNCRGTAFGTKGITWEWQDNSNTESGFIIYNATNNASVGSTAKDVTSFTETGLSTNTAYSRYVVASIGGGVGNSGPSNTAKTFTFANPPMGIASKEVGITYIMLTWEANINPSYTSYEVWVATPEEGSGFPLGWRAAGIAPTTEYTATALSAESVYIFRTRAINGDGLYSDFSDYRSFKTMPPVPSEDIYPPVITRVRFNDRAFRDGDIIFRAPKITATITDVASTEPPYFYNVTPEGVDINSVKVKFGDYVFNVAPTALSLSSTEYVAAAGHPMIVYLYNYVVPASLGSASYNCTIEATDIAFPWYNKGTWNGKVKVMGEKVELVGPTLAYPTPFKPLSGNIATVSYTLSTNANVSVYMYDISGQLLLTKKFSSGTAGGRAGYNQFTWNGRSDFGRIVGNGIYIYKIITSGRSIGTGKIVVMD